MTLASGEPYLPACGPPASFSVNLASSSALTPAGSVHKSRGDNVGAVEEMICGCVCVIVTEGHSFMSVVVTVGGVCFVC